MRHYETLYIVNPELDEENYRAVVDKFRDLIEKENGVVVKLEEWGKQRLAYLVKKFDQGAYVLINYCGGSNMTAELQRDLKLDDRVLNYQTVKLADHADPEALLQKEEEARKETATKEEQAQETEEKAPNGEIESDTSNEEVKNGI
jgi:small subunit ribosomal protein S6